MKRHKNKQSIITRLLAGESVSKIESDTGIHNTSLYKWRTEAKKGKTSGETSKSSGLMSKWVEGERAQLLQLIGEQQLEIMRLRKGK